MYRILYLGYAGNPRAIVNPASAARWFARRSRSPTKTRVCFPSWWQAMPPCGRWALPGEWRRRRPGEEHQR